MTPTEKAMLQREIDQLEKDIERYTAKASIAKKDLEFKKSQLKKDKK